MEQLTIIELIDKFASGLMIVLFLTQVFKFDITRADSSFPNMVIISNLETWIQHMLLMILRKYNILKKLR